MLQSGVVGCVHDTAMAPCARLRGQAGVQRIGSGRPRPRCSHWSPLWRKDPGPGLAIADPVGVIPEKTHAEILKRILAMKHPKDVLLTGYMSAAMEAGNVLISGQATSVAEVRDQVEKAVSEIRAMGGKVYLIQQGPVYATPVSEYVLQNLRRNSAEPLVISRDEYLSKVRLAMPLADKVDGYVDTSDFYCDRAICPSVDEDGQLIIYDRNHVTKAYSLRLAAFVLGHVQADYGAADGGTGAPLR